MTTWEYATIPLITHATKQILDQWGADGWELVQVVFGSSELFSGVLCHSLPTVIFPSSSIPITLCPHARSDAAYSAASFLITSPGAIKGIPGGYGMTLTAHILPPAAE